MVVSKPRKQKKSEKMKITFHGIEIECTREEKGDALEVLRAIAEIAPSVTPSVTRSTSATPSNAESALRAMLKAKGASGMKYTSALRDAGISLESALAKRCREAGCDESAIESALALVGNQAAPIAQDISEIDGDGL